MDICGRYECSGELELEDDTSEERERKIKRNTEIYLSWGLEDPYSQPFMHSWMRED